mmetsp:Transcript_135024/g.305668  ORF Transcript_135024/g.305668 Transcript_135024/m.305668 type:complete len:219 (-) Transcript_135024:1273-1929(-)
MERRTAAHRALMSQFATHHPASICNQPPPMTAPVTSAGLRTLLPPETEQLTTPGVTPRKSSPVGDSPTAGLCADQSGKRALESASWHRLTLSAHGLVLVTSHPPEAGQPARTSSPRRQRPQDPHKRRARLALQIVKPAPHSAHTLVVLRQTRRVLLHGHQTVIQVRERGVHWEFDAESSPIQEGGEGGFEIVRDQHWDTPQGEGFVETHCPPPPPLRD